MLSSQERSELAREGSPEVLNSTSSPPMPRGERSASARMGHRGAASVRYSDGCRTARAPRGATASHPSRVREAGRLWGCCRPCPRTQLIGKLRARCQHETTSFLFSLHLDGQVHTGVDGTVEMECSGS